MAGQGPPPWDPTLTGTTVDAETRQSIALVPGAPGRGSGLFYRSASPRPAARLQSSAQLIPRPAAGGARGRHRSGLSGARTPTGDSQQAVYSSASSPESVGRAGSGVAISHCNISRVLSSRRALFLGATFLRGRSPGAQSPRRRPRSPIAHQRKTTERSRGQGRRRAAEPPRLRGEP